MTPGCGAHQGFAEYRSRLASQRARDDFVALCPELGILVEESEITGVMP